MILAPTLSAFSGSSGVVRPTFSRDFAGEKTLNNGTGPAITFTRASGATFFDVNGVLQTAANNVPRFDHDPATGASRGLLIEEARTNSIRNSQAGGAVVGTPGTLPTNWAVSVATGISREVVATGTLNGLAYIDLKLSGTNTSGTASSVQVLHEATTQIAASTGQSWSASAYIALVAGSFAGITNERLILTERSAAGSSLKIHSVAISSVTATLQRYSVSAALAEATAARVTSGVIGSVADGATIDITLRLAAPQLELGAFPTSYIPTTTAAATRSADSAVVTPISGFYNQSEGTLFAEYATGAVNRGIVEFNVNAITDRIGITNGSTGIPNGRSNVAGNVEAVIPIGAIPAPADNVRFAFAAATDDFQAARNGTLGTADTSGAMPSNLTHCRIGNIGSGSSINHISGHIRKIAYWPKRLSNTLLQQLTT